MQARGFLLFSSIKKLIQPATSADEGGRDGDVEKIASAIDRPGPAHIHMPPSVEEKCRSVEALVNHVGPLADV